jgi:hypothetical protein
MFPFYLGFLCIITGRAVWTTKTAMFFLFLFIQLRDSQANQTMSYCLHIWSSSRQDESCMYFSPGIALLAKIYSMELFSTSLVHGAWFDWLLFPEIVIF